MTGFLKRMLFRFFHRFLRNRGQGAGDEIEEFWEADFSKPGKTHFDIKSESACDAYLRKGAAGPNSGQGSARRSVPNSSLGIGLKKSACLAWVEGTHPYRDMVLKARLRMDPKGGYGAAGIIFRMMDEGTYYLALLSSKRYFRLDVVRNSTPLALIGWTEFGEAAAAPPATESAADAPPAESSGLPETELTIIACGGHITLLINDLWVGEMDDSSIEAGSLGFALASYEAPPGWAATPARGGGGGLPGYAAEAFLDYLSVDTRLAEVRAARRAWDSAVAAEDGETEAAAGAGGEVVLPILRENRLRLAETFAAMGEHAAALAQLKKLWERSGQEGRDLLLAVRLAQALERYDDAEEYMAAAFALSGTDPAIQQNLHGALIEEKAKLLYVRGRYAELRDYIAGLPETSGPGVMLPTLLGHAFWELGDYQEAAAAYDRAFALDRKNGLLAANAANACDLLGQKEEALDRYLAAGQAYLGADNYGDLGALIPKLLALGPDRWEVHALAGKWAFGIEDWEEADREFGRAETLRRRAKTGTGDPALSYLRALLLIRKARRREALPLLEEAAGLAPDYGLFRFRLAENRYLLNNDPADPRLRADLEQALSLLAPTAAPGAPASGETWGWVNNLAAQISLAAGDLDRAAKFLEQAILALGETSPVLVNRAVYHYLRGSLDQALAILDTGAALDTEGSMANCAGNLLVRSGQFEQAQIRYQRALALAPANQEFLTNCSSCLIEMGQYGEADTLLARAHNLAPSPAVLELITYIAVKKGEYSRAESACNAALELDSAHPPSLHSLGWIYSSAGRWEEAGEILARLDSLALSGEDADRREELRRRIMDGTTRLIPCARCDRTWRVPLDPPPAPFLRLVAMPPDELPAGTCTACGTSYCIGCAREHLDDRGRFICPVCGQSLKLINEGLKKIVADWAAETLPGRGTKG
ncbi:MAG: tetratricopeptide repeat protein [Treponema sp.]|jgi:tetratricopeptide (TPR) repeat protein|nr:tetratricopeptide repeat protein [Treponema sp.]